jgi:hypothetical protein
VNQRLHSSLACGFVDFLLKSIPVAAPKSFGIDTNGIDEDDLDGPLRSQQSFWYALSAPFTKMKGKYISRTQKMFYSDDYIKIYHRPNTSIHGICSTVGLNCKASTDVLSLDFIRICVAKTGAH